MGGSGPSSVVVLAGALCACGQNIDPAFEVGFEVEGEFRALEHGDSCPVVDAIQGGFWTMPLLRTQGLDHTLFTACDLRDLDSDIDLGGVESDMTFENDGEGWLRHRLLVFLEHVQTSEDFAALDGHTGRLACSVTDDSMSLAYQREVVLEATRGF